MVYKSKIGWSILAPVIILFSGLTVLFIFQGAWLGLLLMAAVIGLFVHIYTSTYYIIEGSNLQVNSGFFIKDNIDIASIRKIETTNSVLSAPALSLDRIEIFYNKYDSVVISPPDKIQFIADLKAINNAIEFVS